MSKPSPAQIVEDLRARADQIENYLRNRFVHSDQAAEDATVADCAEIATLRAAADFIEKTINHCLAADLSTHEKTPALVFAKSKGYTDTQAMTFACGALWFANVVVDP